MTTTVLNRPQNSGKHGKESGNDTQDLKNTIKHFTINVDIDATKTPQFIHSLSNFESMEKATLLANEQGVCIKLKTSNKNLSTFMLQGIHRNTDVIKTHVVAI